MQRIYVSLDKDEVTALATMAAKECRTCPDQLRYLLRQEAIRRGLLKGETAAAGKVSDPRQGDPAIATSLIDSTAKGTGTSS